MELFHLVVKEASITIALGKPRFTGNNALELVGEEKEFLLLAE